MQIYNITIEPWLLGQVMVAAVLVSFYWFTRSYRRYRNRLRYSKNKQDEIRQRARRRL